MRPFLILFLLSGLPVAAGERPAKNVVLFVGDAAGVPTIHAASVFKYKQPLKLFVQQMPHVGLMDTSAASQWVTDSAAGMTAMVTGHKTHNGVISQSATAVRGKKDGQWLKTILEHAEERGLSTGAVSNSMVLSATPAACYAHVNDRKNLGEVFAQILKPRFGDGIDVIFGPDREEVFKEAGKQGIDVEEALGVAGLTMYTSVEEIPADARRAAVFLESEDFDLSYVTQRAIDVLSHNPNGFFLMVESDCHTSKLIQGLQRMLMLDDAVRDTAERMKGTDTLIIFTADHSYDFRIYAGLTGEALLGDLEDVGAGDGLDGVIMKNVRRFDDHTGEEVPVCAQGPGAELINGYILNTDLFHIMMKAYGWEPEVSSLNRSGVSRRN